MDASGKDETLVGRLRKDVSDPTGRTLALFESSLEGGDGWRGRRTDFFERYIQKGADS